LGANVTAPISVVDAFGLIRRLEIVGRAELSGETVEARMSEAELI